MTGKRVASDGGGQIAGSGAAGRMGIRAAASGSSSSQRPQKRLKRPRNKRKLDDEPDLHATAAQIQISSPRVARPRILRPCSATASQVQTPSPLGSKPSSSYQTLRPCSAAAAQVRPLIPPSSSSWGVKAKRSRSAVPRKRDWANLGDGPVGLIAERVLADEVADYIRLRAVCSPWRRCCADPRARGVLEDRRLLPRRWIMLLGDKENLAAAGAPHLTRRQFLNTSTGQCVRVDVPELRGHGVLRSTTEGLLALHCKATGAVRLLNPLTRQAVELPPFTAGMEDDGFRPGYIAAGRCVWDTVGLVDDDRTVFLMYSGHGGIGLTLAFAKPGDERWALVRTPLPHASHLPAMTFAGRFYSVSDNAVMVLDTTTTRLVVAAELSLPLQRMTDTLHLLDNGGELMLVHRMLRRRAHPDHRESNRFKRDYKRSYKAYRVNLEKRRATPARGFGGRAVFLGRCRAISVSPRTFPSVDANTIYPGLNLHERGGDEQVGAYRLRDGSTESFDFDRDRGPAHPWTLADCLANYASG